MQTTPDKNSLISAIIPQVLVGPNVTADVIRRDAFVAAMTSYGFFAKFLCIGDVNIYNYLKSIADNRNLPTNFVSILTRMYNIKVTLISPECNKPRRLYHDSKNPDVVIVTNGDIHGAKATTHFIATQFKKTVEKLGNRKPARLNNINFSIFKQNVIVNERALATSVYQKIDKELRDNREEVVVMRGKIDSLENEMEKIEERNRVLARALNEVNETIEKLDPELSSVLQQFKDEEQEVKRKRQQHFDKRWEKIEEELKRKHRDETLTEKQKFEKEKEKFKEKQKALEEKEKRLQEFQRSLEKKVNLNTIFLQNLILSIILIYSNI